MAVAKNEFYPKFMSEGFYRFEKSAIADLFYTHLFITCQNVNRDIEDGHWTLDFETAKARNLVADIDEWNYIHDFITNTAAPWLPDQREFVQKNMEIIDTLNGVIASALAALKKHSDMVAYFAPPEKFKS